MLNRFVVGITGASGTTMGHQLLVLMRDMHLETHFVVSKAAMQSYRVEEGVTFHIATEGSLVVHRHDDFAAPISSGSFRHRGMVILPCSINTMSCIANCITPNLICRAADVTLKERRTLILVVRESVLHSGHLENMKKLTDRGATILMPLLNFYSKDRNTLQNQVDHLLMRVLDQLGLDSNFTNLRWKETEHVLETQSE